MNVRLIMATVLVAGLAGCGQSEPAPDDGSVDEMKDAATEALRSAEAATEDMAERAAELAEKTGDAAEETAEKAWREGEQAVHATSEAIEDALR